MTIAARYLKLLTVSFFFVTDPYVIADAVGIAGHQFGFLCTDLQHEKCGVFVQSLH